MEKFVHLTKYVAGSASVNKKEIRNYIKGRCYPFLGDDYYFSYIYKEGILKFIAGKADSYVEGLFPLVLPVLIQKGTFYVRDARGDFYHVFICSEKEIQHYISHSIPENAVELSIQLAESMFPVHKTAKLKWSLSKTYNHVPLVVLLILSLIFHIFMLYKSVNILKVLKVGIVHKQPVYTVKHANQDLASVINKLSKMADLGKIGKLEIQQGKVTVFLVFPSEEDCYKFISKHGGTYDNKKVVYSVNISSL